MDKLGKLPGVNPYAGREFWYVQWADGDSFAEAFLNISTCDAGGLPTHGGILLEEACIETPQGVSFFGVSFKGDLEGWKRNLLAFAKQNDVLTGQIIGTCLHLSDGTQLALKDCVIQVD